jgi:hypothetical protein
MENAKQMTIAIATHFRLLFFFMRLFFGLPETGVFSIAILHNSP